METLFDPIELASPRRSGPGPRANDATADVVSSLVAIDERLEEDAMVEELGPDLARQPGARLRLWCSED